MRKSNTVQRYLEFLQEVHDLSKDGWVKFSSSELIKKHKVQHCSMKILLDEGIVKSESAGIRASRNYKWNRVIPPNIKMAKTLHDKAKSVISTYMGRYRLEKAVARDIEAGNSVVNIPTTECKQFVRTRSNDEGVAIDFGKVHIQIKISVNGDVTVDVNKN